MERRDHPPDAARGRRDRSQVLRPDLVPAVAVAIPASARPCSAGLALHPDLRARDAPVLSDRGRQGARAQGRVDLARRHLRDGGAGIVQRRDAISARLHSLAYHQSDRRRTRRPAVLPSAAAADALFRDPRGGADRRADARTGNHPHVSHQPGSVLAHRSPVHGDFHRRAVRLFLGSRADRPVLGAGLCRDRAPGEAVASREDQAEVHPQRRIPAVPGRGGRRHADPQGGRDRADHAGELGGETRRLCQDRLRSDPGVEFRAERDPVCLDGRPPPSSSSSARRR